MSQEKQKKQSPYRVLIAAGGTGGHLFPAQAVAANLTAAGVEVRFAGSGLEGSRCFQKDRFSYVEVSSGTPFGRKGIFKVAKALGTGFGQSLKLLKQFRPDLCVGFGSFHTFPILLATACKRTPFVLFESNCIPGKVNRLFSKWAKFNAVQFIEAARHLRGTVQQVQMPMMMVKSPVEDPFSYFGLQPGKFTFLIFGGSQGAGSINRLFLETIKQLSQTMSNFQIIHLTGDIQEMEKARELYELLAIPACVKPFEARMDLAWTAATLAICRSGGATLAEMMAYEVPAILIPFPRAADNHQQKNGWLMEKKIGGGIVISESQADPARLKQEIENLIDSDQQKLRSMKSDLISYNNRQNKQELSHLITQLFL